MQCFGARNTRGFSSQIQYGNLPDSSHITYEGVFNQLRFNVGPKPQKLLDIHLGYARYQFAASQHDNKINDYLALFLKGSKDGADRDQRPINALICLDISGSMGGGLGGQSFGKERRSRLQLSVEAIKMFISKLRPNDSVGLVTFENKAHVIFNPVYKRDLSLKVFEDLDKITVGGGTTIRNGFSKSKELLQKFVVDNECVNSENRIIMLTDVCDNSIADQKDFIEEASEHSAINLTIVGISDEFRSEVCECLKNVRGFNYFCAVTQDDIKKYVFETFDFGFFPSVYDIEIGLTTEQITSFEVYGAPDTDLVSKYNSGFSKSQTDFVVSRVKSSFPSEIEIEGDTVFTIGGLILLKLVRKDKEPFFRGEVSLRYRSPFGQSFSQVYPLDYAFHPQEQFFSDQSLREAIQGYTFASEMKILLRQSQRTSDKRLLYEKYWRVLEQLLKITPEKKLMDLESTRKIIAEYKNYKPQSIEYYQQNDY